MKVYKDNLSISSAALYPPSNVAVNMSLGIRLLAFGFLAAWRGVDSAAINSTNPNTFQMPPQPQQQQQPNRNVSAPSTADFKAFMGADQMRQQQATPPMQPFGINAQQPFQGPTPPPGFMMPMMTQSPGFVASKPPPQGMQPVMLMPGMTPPPGMMIMMAPLPPAQQQQQQQQPQPPQQPQVLKQVNTTAIPPSQLNNNTRRDTDKVPPQLPVTTVKPANVTTTLKSTQEVPMTTEHQQQMKQQPMPFFQQQFPQPQFGQQQQFFMPPNMMPFNPMMINGNPMMMSQPVMMDAQGRLWFVTQPQFDFNRNPFAIRDTNLMKEPQGPPVPPPPVPLMQAPIPVTMQGLPKL